MFVAADGDIVICMGAGDITKWAAGLAKAIGKERSFKVTPASRAAGSAE